MKPLRKVITLGLDGLEPTIVDSMLPAGSLPNFAALKARGGYGRVATTAPAQTPVAWSSFATGTNPGGHGIFDFLRRDPQTYRPQLSLNRYEQKNPFVPPKAVNLRRGTPIWQHLSQASIPSVVLRCPCTYPPDDEFRGRMLSGMGVPDLRGGFGTGTFYTSAADVEQKESETAVRVEPDGDMIRTHLVGPRNPKTGGDVHLAVTLRLNRDRRTLVVQSSGEPRELEIQEGRWSDWLHVKFKVGMLQSMRGMLRFYLRRLEPVFELYASPVNFDPEAPQFPISSPPEYASNLTGRLGAFYTAGMVEDHTGLSNGRFDEVAFLDQCEDVWRERREMMFYELERFSEGFFFCLFDTPDRIQHMFWRFREPDHPAGRGRNGDEFAHVIEDHYRTCDALLGEVLEHCDDETLLIVLSDHGFNSFRRGVHLNTWLYDQGLLALNDGDRPGEADGDCFTNVDWSRTRAYALGLAGIYLNLKGREGQGIVEPDDAAGLRRELAQELSGLRDPQTGNVAVRSVREREDVYRGPYTDEAPDLLVNFAPGYRASWSTALGGVPQGPTNVVRSLRERKTNSRSELATFEDNTKRWAGDHIIDPELVPGVMLMNRTWGKRSSRPNNGASLVDLAPTISAALGVPAGSEMEGESLL